MNAVVKSMVGSRRRLMGQKSALALASAIAVADLLTSNYAHAITPTWSATPTNNNWEAAGTENNWGITTAPLFPGIAAAGSNTNADTAYFGNTVTNGNISINATTPNTSPLNIGNIGFTGQTTTLTPTNYVIGTATGNSIVTTSDATLNATTYQFFISGSLRGAALASITASINAPIVLSAQSSTTPAFFAFQNNSTANAADQGDKLVINGSITGGATSATGSYLTLTGGNTNLGNAINGGISDGGITAGLGIDKIGAGDWTIGGSNTYTGPTICTGGLLNITGTSSGGGVYNVSGSTMNFNSSGTVTAASLNITSTGGTFQVSGGTVNVTGAITAAATSNGRSFNLYGGVLEVGTSVYSTATGDLFNFYGGTLKAGSAAGLAFDATTATTNTNHTCAIQTGGATLDTTIGNINSTALFQGFAGAPITVTGGHTFLANVQNNGLMTIQGTSTWDMNGSGGSTTPGFNNSSVNGLAGSGTIINSSGTNVGTLTDSVPTATTYTYSGKIAPATTSNVNLVLSGAGTQIFSGTAHTFTGTTNITNGTLSVTGSFTSSPITVNGGFLSGTGTVGTVTLGAGTLDPGIASTDGSVGTLTVTNLTANAGNVRLDVASPGASDSIVIAAGGTANFNTGSAASTVTLVGTPAAGTYILVNASAGSLTGSSPNLSFPTGTRSSFTPYFGTDTTNFGSAAANIFDVVVTGNAASLNWSGGASNVWDVNNSVNWLNTGTSSADKFYNLDSITFGTGAMHESITLNQTVQPTAMTVNSSDNYSISGTGNITGINTALTVEGGGTLTMATTNSYGGGTNIASGSAVQVGNGGTTGSLGTGTITNNGTLTFNLSSGTTLSTAVNGTGTLQQQGVGTLIITGSNNYTGATNISAGTVLQLGNGGTTGNLGATSGVLDNGTLVFNRSNPYTISAPITGSGSLQVSAGALSLSGSNTYTGTTTIAAGATLQIGSGGTTGSVGTGALTNNGTLAFNLTSNVSAGSLSGVGGIAQNGAGLLQLTQAGSYSGLTTISNGTLVGQHPNAFGNTSAINISSGSATLGLQWDTSATFGQPMTGGAPYTVNLTSSGGTVNVNQLTTAGSAAKTLTIGNISGAASTSTSFTLNFTGANNTGLTAGTLSGPTSSAPTVNIINNNSTGTTTISSYQSNNTNSGGIETLNVSGSGSTVITGGILNGAGDMNINMNGGVNPGTGMLTIMGSSNFGGNLTGTSIQVTNGTLAIGSDTALGNTTAGNASLEILNLNAPDPAVGVIQSADTNTRTIGNTLSQSSTNFTYGATGTGNLVFTNVFNKGQFPKNMIVNCPVVTLSGGIFSTGTANGDGTYGSNGALIKSGPGTLILTADSSVSQVSSGPNFNGLWLSTPVNVNAGTLVVANGLSNGSATGTNDVTVNGGTLASDPTNGGAILGNVLAGSGAHVIAPGGVGAVGTLEAGGLTTSNLTTLNFDLGTGTGVVTNGDLLLLGYTTGVTPVHAGSVNIGSGTALTFGGSPVIGDDYRLIGDFTSGAFISGIPLSNFALPAAPSGKSYSLSSTVDPGYIDLVVGVGPSGPSSLTWNNAGGGGNGTTWDTTQINWNNGTGVVAYSNNSNTSTGDNVTFNDSNNGHYAVTISGVVNPSAVVFNNSMGNYTVGGTNSSSGISGPTSLLKLGTSAVTLSSSNTYTGGTNVSAGKLVIASANAFPSNGSTGTTLTVGAGAVFQVATHGSGSSYEPIISSLTNGGLIDITNNEMLFKGASLSTINSQVAAAYNPNGTWKTTGNGLITSSTVSGLTTVGVATVGSDVLVKATYYGDANLDGTVTTADYTLIDGGFLGHLTGWHNGDFNYDNVVNGSDYTLIDNAFNTQGATLSAQIASPTAQIAGGAASAVPEPASVSLIAIGALGLLGRRNRRHS